MSETLKLVRIDEAKLERLDAAQAELAELAGGQAGSMTQVIRQAQAIQALREMLTPEIMAPIMALQGNPLGYVTDRDKDGGYQPPVVKDVTIWAAGRGARMVGNEVNIISSRGYLTKSFFARKLDEALGMGNWMHIHGVPRMAPPRPAEPDANGRPTPPAKPDGALVKTTVRWLADGKWQTQELEHAIRVNSGMGTDAILGKADRKCSAWLLARVCGRRYEDGDADDSIPTTATPFAGPLRPPHGAPEVTVEPETTQTTGAANE